MRLRRKNKPDWCEILLTYPRVHGLAWGGLGESSGSVHALQQIVARGIAAHRWRGMGARSQEEALGFVTSALRRRWGIAACRAQARHRLRRLIWVGARGRDRRPDGGAVGEADGDALAAVAAQHFQAPHAQGGGGWAR